MAARESLLCPKWLFWTRRMTWQYKLSVTITKDFNSIVGVISFLLPHNKSYTLVRWYCIFMRGSRKTSLVKRYEIPLFSRILQTLECNQNRILKHHHEKNALMLFCLLKMEIKLMNIRSLITNEERNSIHIFPKKYFDISNYRWEELALVF